jgi:SAM-dependent methyltransferase
MRPSRIALNETLKFIERLMPPRPASVLDVGCGKGEIAAELHARGFAVTAIDTEREAVLLTRARGVLTREADFAKYDAESTPFDVVLFGRSLHHIHPLASAIERAHALLKPGGLLIAEELDLAAMNATTAMWHYDGLALLDAVGLIPRDPDEDARKPLAPLDRWKKEHEHDPRLAERSGASRENSPGVSEAEPQTLRLHAGASMIAAVESRFKIIEKHAVPYLYRTACSRVEESARGLRAVEAILRAESLGIERGLLVPIGLRIVAKRSA